MNIRTLLTVNAVYVLLVALSAILAPSFLLELNGLEVNETTSGLYRVIGAVIVGYGVISWLMRNAKASVALRAFLIGSGLGYFVSAVVIAFNNLSGLGSGTGWVFVLISIGLGAALLNFGLKQSATE